jgi:hypothetical protein
MVRTSCVLIAGGGAWDTYLADESCLNEQCEIAIDGHEILFVRAMELLDRSGA